MSKSSIAPAVVYRVMELLVKEKLRIPQIVERMKKEFPAAGLTRESIYPLLPRAVELDFVRLMPPLEEKTARELESKFSCPAHTIQVVDCPLPASNDSVSVAAAGLAIRLLQDLQGKVDGPIGVGLGPGRATLDFARSFSQQLAEDLALPKLNLVAISAGCPARYPEYASTSFFNLFRSGRVEKRIGLFAETLVRSKDYAEIQTRPGVREAFEAKKDIHLIVTSMGDMEDPHGLLRIFYEQSAKPISAKRAVGDVQYRPFTARGFIKEGPDELRAVTLFELEDLVRLAKEKDRHVILIARQCGACIDKPRSRARPLRPLLQNPNMRVFSHLVTDTPTAAALLSG